MLVIIWWLCSLSWMSGPHQIANQPQSLWFSTELLRRDCITSGLKGQERDTSLRRDQLSVTLLTHRLQKIFPTLTQALGSVSLAKGESSRSHKLWQFRVAASKGKVVSMETQVNCSFRQWARQPAPLFQNSGSCDPAAACGAGVHFSAPTVPVYATLRYFQTLLIFWQKPAGFLSGTKGASQKKNTRFFWEFFPNVGLPPPPSYLEGLRQKKI